MIYERPLFWIGSSYDDLKALPDEVMREFGYGLDYAQRGGKHPKAKPLKGFGGGVLEIIALDVGGTYRCVYTVRFSKAVYALHVFQKKAKRGVSTPKQELNLVKERLRRAENHYEEWIET